MSTLPPTHCTKGLSNETTHRIKGRKEGGHTVSSHKGHAGTTGRTSQE